MTAAGAAPAADVRLARSFALAEQRQQRMDAGLRALLGRAVALWEGMLEGSDLDREEVDAVYESMTVLDHEVRGVQRSVKGTLDLAESMRSSPGLLAAIGAAAATAATIASSLNAALHCLAPRVEGTDAAGRSLSASLQMGVRFLRTALQASSTLSSEIAQVSVPCRNPVRPSTQVQP